MHTTKRSERSAERIKRNIGGSIPTKSETAREGIEKSIGKRISGNITMRTRGSGAKPRRGRWPARSKDTVVALFSSRVSGLTPTRNGTRSSKNMTVSVLTVSRKRSLRRTTSCRYQKEVPTQSTIFNHYAEIATRKKGTELSTATHRNIAAVW